MEDHDRVALTGMQPKTVDAQATHPDHPKSPSGEVRAGPGDAGLEDRPEINPGKRDRAQMSNGRLIAGLGIAATIAGLMAILAFLF